ncbi:cytochrome c oxidase subunit 12, mitochondrial [Gastrolobium bilobum]|uniref:cytochrome c oxidase subunit 12, mitochondrial n=1 Tax=Gastrolobium bilobum TaxID=150636 RepID=UPI002AB05FB7|nr:cytochrome c oxidase subunit 12, mitochondrial [Gastrolobium bilobum]
MSASAPVDPHDKMRARDVSKVARGEQAPRPVHEYGIVSPPPPPSSTDNIDTNNNKEKNKKLGAAENGAEIPPTNYQMRRCYVKYVEYHRCIKQRGETAPECEKLGTEFRSLCPTEWIEEWDKEREEGKFPGEI